MTEPGTHDRSEPGVTSSARYMPDDWTLPQIDEHNEAYFTAGELLLERCSACGHVQHPASGACGACQQVDTERVSAEPVGTVVTSTVVHHPLHPMLRDRVPYNVVVVELRDQPTVRIIGNVVGTPHIAVPLGLVVRGAWTEPLGERRVRLLQWFPA